MRGEPKIGGDSRACAVRPQQTDMRPDAWACDMTISRAWEVERKTTTRRVKMEQASSVVDGNAGHRRVKRARGGSPARRASRGMDVL